MIEMYAKIVDNQITEISSGIGTSGTWVTVEGYQGEDQTLWYDPTLNIVKCKDEIDEIPEATIEQLEAVKLEMDILDKKHKVTIIEDSPYDPTNEKIRA